MFLLSYEFVKDFPIVPIEDLFDQDNWSSRASLQSTINVQLVGDGSVQDGETEDKSFCQFG